MFSSRIPILLKRGSPFLAGVASFSLSINASCDGGPTKSGKMPDCEVPACSSTINSLNQAMLGVRKRGTTSALSASGAADVAAGSSSSISDPQTLTGCPIDINVLGASAWNLIHTVAEHIPDEPSEDDQRRIESFIVNLAYLYPCHICRDDFVTFVTEHPPRVTSKVEFSLWCCEMHNNVNAKLGKETIKCTREDLKERWYVNTNPANKC